MIEKYKKIHVSSYWLIPKTIENRKGDCAWSCSRWQTQPEKISKLQRTNQCPLRTLYWFVLCNLEIFSGCVCHLEQLHAQSPFLFPIVFGINLIPFFDIGSVLAILCWSMRSFTWATTRSQLNECWHFGCCALVQGLKNAVPRPTLWWQGADPYLQTARPLLFHVI